VKKSTIRFISLCLSLVNMLSSVPIQASVESSDLTDEPSTALQSSDSIGEEENLELQPSDSIDEEENRSYQNCRMSRPPLFHQKIIRRKMKIQIH